MYVAVGDISSLIDIRKKRRYVDFEIQGVGREVVFVAPYSSHLGDV
jgi:hypothetical protein